MSNDLSSSESSAAARYESGLTAVLAHSMLGTVTAIRGAIDLARAETSTSMSRDSLLLLATHRVEFLASQLRDLAGGVPASLVSVEAPTSRHGAGLVDAGTQVEVYSAFDRTWSAGFEIASVTDAGYRVRRLSDGSLLPGYTTRSDLRTTYRRESRPPSSGDTIDL